MTVATLEDARQHFEPICEVWIKDGPWTPPRLIIGNPRPAEITSLRRVPVKPRRARELVEWLATEPDEIDRALEHHEIQDVDIVEVYCHCVSEVADR